MSYLLDTHVFLWAQTDDPQLGPLTREVVEDGAIDVWLSVASAWEIAIKASRGRLEIPDDLVGAVHEADFPLLPVGLAHAAEVVDLPHHHRDPFDRMLVAQARVEGLTLITADEALAAYDVELLDARD